jgi:hypothetical protein
MRLAQVRQRRSVDTQYGIAATAITAIVVIMVALAGTPAKPIPIGSATPSAFRAPVARRAYRQASKAAGVRSGASIRTLAFV